MPHSSDSGQSRGDVGERASLVISREVAALQKRYFGKGPEKVRTVYASDMVTVLLSGGFTAIEKTLQDDGQASAVDDNRMAFQRAMGTRFKDVVVRATGRNVVAFMSANHQDPDMSVEVFVLGPVAGAAEDPVPAASVGAGDPAGGPVHDEPRGEPAGTRQRG